MDPSDPLNLSLVAHADWSIHASKRFVCVATREAGAGFVVEAPVLAGSIGEGIELCRALSERTSGFGLLGMDVPLGVPRAWARLAGVSSFEELLSELAGEGRWARFYEPAESADEIALERPFYPRRPGGTSRAQLVEGLGLSEPDELRRYCDMPRKGTATPCPIFWTLGANQVGKAAITAWRDVLAPALSHYELDVRLWPFEGGLYAATRGDLGVAEVYPGEIYSWLELDLSGGGKRSQEARARNAPRLLAALDALGASAQDALADQIEDGFGGAADGEDRFDSFVGALGGMQVALGRRKDGAPTHRSSVWSVEGWVLGREA